ncbi:MAG: hypothetical protein WCB46_00690 [Methanoregula sp.]
MYENRGFLHEIPEWGCPEGQSGAVEGPDWGVGDEVLCRGSGEERDTFPDIIEENGVPVILLRGCERNNIQSKPYFLIVFSSASFVIRARVKIYFPSKSSDMIAISISPPGLERTGTCRPETNQVMDTDPF